VLELRQQFPLAGLLRIAGLARSTFYYQQQALKGEDKHRDLKASIRSIFDRHKGLYGYRRVTAALRESGHVVNHKTVQRLMCQMKLRSRVRVKKFRRFAGQGSYIAPDLLKRDFTASAPNEKWVTDVTEFSVGQRKLYLSPIMDLYNGEIVAYDTSETPVPGMVEKMLNRAFERLTPSDRPILHSDQGWQYRMPRYHLRLEQRSISQSMSRKGNCLDNAAMESFFGTLKSEFFYLNEFDSTEQLADGIQQYIRYYNEERIKTRLKTSPVSFRLREAAA
jgi:putative transposase